MDPPASAQNAAAGEGRLSAVATTAADGKKKRKHRAGKKRRNRRPSFAAASETSAMASGRDGPADDPLIEEAQPSPIRQSIYRSNTRNRSNESLDSEALLDHRDQPTLRPRRESRLNPLFASSYRQGRFPNPDTSARNRQRGQQDTSSRDGSDNEDANDKTPLLSGGAQQQRSPEQTGYGLFRVKSNTSTISVGSKQPRRLKTIGTPSHSVPKSDASYDVNNPPSVPGSPRLGALYEDVMVDEVNFLNRSSDSRRNLTGGGKDVLIDIDGERDDEPNSAPPSPRLRPGGLQRHRSTTMDAEADVCFPTEDISETGDVFDVSHAPGQYPHGQRRRRREREDWPKLWVLEEWAREEKEARAAGERRAKKISEPVFVEGRLRPRKSAWHRVEEDKQYRFTYFNEDFGSTIHAETISELVQPDGGFRELFIPDPPEIADSSGSEDEDVLDMTSALQSPKSTSALEKTSGMPSLADSLKPVTSGKSSDKSKNSGSATPQNRHTSTQAPKPKKYGPRPTFWLDVLCPTETEMRVLGKAFGIHALTTEDVLMQEAREKVELFRHYYFINYRTFEQDTHSEDYLEPINMYVCVFGYGIITFHFSPIPHPANVRRRIRQLSDYLLLSADWISYAIIDDITDVYGPLITHIEEEVDAIDDLILRAFQHTAALAGEYGEKGNNEKGTDEGDPGVSGIDMLIRIGECRKKVMSMYRLLGNKADVIKGFAKRCNEQWEVAPKSEIGLYLGDIQDHILTMTGNLSHYETLLSRAHGNYLAQVSIHMNERQEKVCATMSLPEHEAN
jgi:magnesium transporter